MILDNTKNRKERKGKKIISRLPARRKLCSTEARESSLLRNAPVLRSVVSFPDLQYLYIDEYETLAKINRSASPGHWIFSFQKWLKMHHFLFRIWFFLSPFVFVLSFFLSLWTSLSTDPLQPYHDTLVMLFCAGEGNERTLRGGKGALDIFCSRFRTLAPPRPPYEDSVWSGKPLRDPVRWKRWFVKRIFESDGQWMGTKWGT